MDSPSLDVQSSPQGDSRQQTVASYEIVGASITEMPHAGQTAQGATAFVDILAQLPQLAEIDFAANGPIPDQASTADQKVAATIETATASLDDAAGNGSNPTLQQGQTELAQVRESVFVDTGISDYQQLVDDLIASRSQGREVEVIILDSTRDGIEQVSEALAGRQDLDAVHFVTHGADGQIQLGNTRLNSETLEQNRAMVSRWGDALTEAGDIFFYGCNIAAESSGQSLLNNIAGLTGADVAASDDHTGNARLGGDWVLEFENGEIETNVAFRSDVQQNWFGVLATFNVNTTNDTADANPGDGLARDASGNTSLRAAIMEANALAGADEIVLGTGTYTLSLGPSGDDAAARGDLDVTGDLTITGAGAKTTFIDGAAADRVFEVLGANVTMSDLTIQNGAASDGGGIRVDGAGSLALRDVAVAGNVAASTGGGILVSGTLSVDRVTIEGNRADVGGGVYVNNSASATLTNATLSGNSAISVGGAISTRANIGINNSTIAGNTAVGAGGINKQGSGNATLKNTMLANNTGGNASGVLSSLGNNIDSDGTAGLSQASDLKGTIASPLDVKIGLLRDNGGPTNTHALLAGSPAINAGTATGAPPTDQRGVARLGATDIGAYEYSVIGYEPFAYPAGSFNGANGGSGWANSWSNVGTSTTVTATGLQDPTAAMPVSGGAAELRLLSFQTVTQSRNLSTTLGAPGTTAWLSFLVKPDGTQAGDYAGIEFGSPSASIAFAGYTNGRFVLEQAGGAGTVVVNGISPSAGQTYLLTVRMDFAAGADTLTLYVNPTPGLASPDSTFTASKTNLDLGSFTRIALAGGESWMDNDAVLDELRLSSSYLDAVPSGGAITGTLFHDVDGDADITEAGTLRFAGATVRLYRDNGNGTPGTGDTLARTTTTNALGEYAFTGLSDGNYWLAIDSKTLTASGYNGGYAADDVWTDQTYGVAGAMQGAGYLASAGALFGGRYASTSDNASALATSEHITRVGVTGGDVTGVDAGFSFSAIVNTRGDTTDDDGVGSGRLQQGSLRQFLINANAISGAQAANFSVGTGAITIAPNAALPTLTDAVVLDATTQEGFAGAPVVELNGSSAGAGASGFVLNAAASGSTIRGFVLNRFGEDLIQLAGSDNNIIAGNYLGTDLTGTIDRGAGDSGVQLSGGASGNRIGGTTAADRNVLSGNSYAGIAITGSGTDNNLIQGNLIGTAVDGIGAIGNSSFGVVTWNGADGNQIGGAADGAGNVIANNNRGVIVDANSINSVNNAILGNRIFGNTTLGIDLYPTGVRANDLGDGDSGPNNYQNYPVLASARTDGTQINLTGTLNSTANTSFRIEFFASATGDASGHGEAERYLGFVNVTTDGSGNAPFNTWLTAAVAVGESISATATRASAGFTSFYDTSEFALNRTATALNSAPVNTLPGPVTEAEDTTLAITGLSVSDVDGNLSSVQLSVANGVLNLSLAGGATISSGANNSASVTLAGTQAQLNAALATLTYRGGADFNGGDVLTIHSTDAGGLSDTDNVAITVNPVNDAPVLSGANNLSTINEDPAGNPGTPVSALIAGQTSDVDAGALTGIAVTAVNNTNGTWQYSINGGTTWNAFGSPSNASARLLAADASTYVRFVPNANWNGTVAGGLTFRAWDRTSGSAGGTADTSSSGGTSAFSADTASGGITVNPMNDNPSGLPVIAGNATKGQTLTAVTNGIGDEDGLGSFNYQWLRDDAEITGAITDTYVLGNGDVGTQISVRVSYTDDRGTPESITSAQVGPVANVNYAPVGLPTITGTLTEDQTLTAVTSGISDADGLGTFSYQWLRNGVAIIGATADTFTLGDADVGAEISVQVSYLDGLGSNESLISTAVGPVDNVNDNPTGLAVISGTPTEDQTLTASNTLADADGIGTVSYQWQRNGLDIAGATDSTYQLGDSDVGATIKVVASYTDLHGTPESVTSAPTAAVANVNDAPVGLPFISGTVTEDQTLTADTSGITDADGLSGAFSYQWLRNSSAIGGATGSTYTLGDADVGTQISVRVSYTDDQLTPEALTSAPTAEVVNVNDAPTGVVTIDNLTPAEGDTLTASNSLADADGLSGPIGYQWRRNGLDIAGATGNTYTTVQADVDAVISVVASYTDDQGELESVTSTPTVAVINVNNPPTGSVTISGPPTEDQTLTASNTLADEDGIGSVSYQWQRNWVDIAGATDSTYVLGDADVGAAIRVVASYTDGYGVSESVASAAVGPVVNVNDAPVANDDSTTTNEDTPVTVNVVGNDSDVEGDTLVVSAVTQGTNGTVTFAGGSVTYTPNANFNGSDGFTYTLSDGNGGTAIATINVTVIPANDAPVGNDDTATTNEDTPVTVNVVSNDSDVDGDTLVVSAVTQGANGTVSFAGGSVTYTPNANFNGSDSFTYTLSDGNGGTAIATVNVTVTPVNDAPIANDDSAATNEDSPVTVNAIANDSDVEGDVLVVSAVTQGANGTVTFAGGSVTYTPNASFNGSDSFTYTVSDGNGGTAAATVNVTVNADNDAPVANNDSATTNEDTPVTINVVSNDTDIEGDTLVVSAVTQGTNGTVTFSGGSVTYTPDDNFNGTDSFTYTVSDGNGGTATATASVTVNPVNDAPAANADSATTNEDSPITVNVVGNDSDVEGDPLVVSAATQGANGTVTFAGGSVTYTPNDNFNGTDSFTYTVSDGNGGTSSAIVNVTVNPVNDAPVAVDDSATTNRGTSVAFNVAANDSDIEGDRLTVNPTPVRDASHGTLVLNADGTFIYTPDANFTGVDSFTYEVSDGKGGVAQATVTISVFAAKAAPTGGDSIEPKADGAEPTTASLDTPSLSLPEHPDVTVTEVLQADVVNESNLVSNQDSIKKNGLTSPSIKTAFRSFLQQAVSRDSSPADAASIALNDVKESLSYREPGRDKPSTAVQKEDLQSERAYSAILALAYEYLRNSLDAVKEEMAGDHQLSKVYLGSAIVSSVGLSVGYVVWLLRGGMLIGSLLSSLPAWQILDPLPILVRKKDGEHSEDDESLESILHKKARSKTKIQGAKVLGSEPKR